MVSGSVIPNQGEKDFKNHKHMRISNSLSFNHSSWMDIMVSGSVMSGQGENDCNEVLIKLKSCLCLTFSHWF